MPGTPTRRAAARSRFIAELKDARKLVKFSRDPLRTCFLISLVVARETRNLGALVVKTRKRALYPTVMFLAFCLWIKDTTGPHAAFVDECERLVEWAAWWVALGVASSVGFGSGMHTGLLFLFPHILKVCQTAERCGNVDFDTRKNTWFMMSAEDLFECAVTPKSRVRYVDIWLRVLPACVAWGVGTAFGEIPPYWVSYFAAKAGRENKELSELTEVDVRDMDDVQRRIHGFKLWMIGFMKRYGFLGLLAMSSWPNAAFDLCGVCCGSFMMPFWVFITATTIGKGFIKSPIQGLVLTVLFYKSSREKIIAFCSGWLPKSWEVDKSMSASINSMLQKVLSSGSAGKRTKQSFSLSGLDVSPSKLWGYFVTSLMTYFLVSCLEEIARLEQARLDVKRVNDRYPGQEHLD